jgi:DTW domain-containing protein YfiP
MTASTPAGDPFAPVADAPHAVARLRATRLTQSGKPFAGRGARRPRCPACRVIASHCFCALRPEVETTAGMCLIMGDIEALKPSNTGWLIADVVQATSAFGWARTAVDPGLLRVLADPQWTPYLVFPGDPEEPKAAGRMVTGLADKPGTRPLFVLLDGTWTEAHKMFRKSPYLDQLPLLSLQPEQLSRYRLRRAASDAHLCTAEVAALCLAMAGEAHAADTLGAYLEVFTGRYLDAKNSVRPDTEDAAHQRLRGLAVPPRPVPR